jgi:TRAP-type transport system small permease protein
MAATFVLSALCTFVIRDDFRSINGRVSVWSAFECFLAQFFMILMLGSAALQVLVRYFSAIDALDLLWTEEFSRLVLVWAAFFGAAALQRQDDHIRMTLFYDYMPAEVQFALRVLGDIVTILVLLPIVYLGWQTARNLDIMNTIALGVPLSTFAYPVPLAGALMMLHTMLLLAGRLKGHEPAPPATPGVN